MDDHPGVDMLSDLPLSIIHIILSLVPIRDAVRTSILSTQWRYTWASIPHLVFDERCANQDEKTASESEERLKNFITHALSIHKGSIHKFELSLSLQESCPNMDEWLLCLSRKDITELILNLGYRYSWQDLQQVHSCIYSCNKLTYLELHSFKVGPPPSTFKGFLFLRCLILHFVRLSPKGIESLVANCPLLERFDLQKFDILEVRISAPNLKYLSLDGDFIEIYLHAPLLAEMWVDLNNSDFTPIHQEQKSSVCNYANFIGGCTNLEKLIGYFRFTKVMTIGLESCRHSFVFHRLRDIELNDVDFQDVKQMLVLSRLVTSSPNLQKLKIVTDFCSVGEAGDVSFRDFKWAPNFMTFEKLMVVKMRGVSGLFFEKEFIKFLLRSSPGLQTMSLISSSKELDTDELMGYSRASPSAKISISLVSKSKELDTDEE